LFLLSIESLYGMTWSRRSGDSRARPAAPCAVPAATVSLQRVTSGRGMVVVAAVWLLVLMSLAEIVVHTDGFVVEPASSPEISRREVNDSDVKPSSTG